MKISYIGPPGSFSHQACLNFVPDGEPVAEASFGDVAKAVIEQRSDRGILPLENVIAGPVADVRRLLDDLPLRSVGQYRLSIRLHLLGLPGVRLDDIHVAVSHPVALAQCGSMIERHGLRVLQASSTSAAARDLKSTKIGALASETAAQYYGLNIVLRDVQDRADNSTLFILVARA